MKIPTQVWRSLSMSIVAAIALIWALAGCEKNAADGTRFLTVQPSQTLLGTNLLSVVFTVTDGTRDLSFPLEWSVSDATVGFIVQPSAGLSATYRRVVYSGKDVPIPGAETVNVGDNTYIVGPNTIIVRDQYGAEGYATVMHVRSDSPVTSTTSTTTTTGTATTTSTAGTSTVTATSTIFASTTTTSTL